MKRFKIGSLLTAAAMTVVLAFPSSAMASVGRQDHQILDYRSTAQWPSEEPEIGAESAYVIELNSGAVIYDKNGEDRSYPASTTKCLTAYLALQNLPLDQNITFTYDSSHNMEKGGYHYEFQEGEILNVDECLQFLMVESVNECAYVLAEAVSGNISDFCDRMNETAAAFGATDTHFNNPHGLNDENHYSTAKDMAMILWGCIQDERFRQYAASPTVNLAGRAIKTGGFTSYVNHHEMLLPSSKHYDPDVVCGKTGHTSIAGGTLVTYAKRGNMDVIVVIMKGEDTQRFYDTKALLDYTFDNFELVSASESSDSLLQAAGSSLKLDTCVTEDRQFLIPKGGEELLTSAFTGRSSEDAPEVLGTRTWSYDGVELGSTSVSLTENAEAHLTAVGLLEDSTEGAEQKKDTKDLFDWIILAVLGVIFVILISVLVHLALTRIRKERQRKRREELRRRRMERERRNRNRS